jgi:hypothetical protein
LIGILIAAAVACSPSLIAQSEAQTLVLQTPDAIASIAQRGAKVAAELSHTTATGWVFRVYATNTSSPSNLIGYYAVNNRTAAVSDFVLDEAPVSGPELRAAQTALLEHHCSN